MCVGALGITRFPNIEGERTFYLNSSSSQALIKEELSILDFATLKGESIRFSCKDGSIAEKIATELGGEILFTERVGEVCSYYCFTPKWSDGVRIEGRFINLHIAVGKGTCVVGTPIIFGGF